MHEITDAIDVSERTFFRYFAGKEDLALAFIKKEMDEFVTALRAQPRTKSRSRLSATPFARLWNTSKVTASRAMVSRGT